MDVWISMWIYALVAIGLGALYMWLRNIWACVTVLAFIWAGYIFVGQLLEGTGKAWEKRLAWLKDELKAGSREVETDG